MAESPRLFSYTSSVGTLVKMIAVSVIGALLLGHLAFTNERGLVIQRAVRLDPEGATIFYWCVFVVNVAGAVIFTMALTRRKSSPRRLELHESYLLAPASRWILSSYEQVIPYRSVSEIQITQVGQERVLKVRHRAGLLHVEESQMSSRDDFEAFAGMLKEKVAHKVATSTGRAM